MQPIRFSAILLLTLTLACSLTPTPAAPAAGETPAPTGAPTAPATPGEAPAAPIATRPPAPVGGPPQPQPARHPPAPGLQPSLHQRGLAEATIHPLAQHLRSLLARGRWLSTLDPHRSAGVCDPQWGRQVTDLAGAAPLLLPRKPILTLI